MVATTSRRHTIPYRQNNHTQFGANQRKPNFAAFEKDSHTFGVVFVFDKSIKGTSDGIHLYCSDRFSTSNLLLVQNLQKDSPNAANTTGGGQRSQPSGAKLSKPLSTQSHEAISAIFKLISDKETGREGIQKLYEFKVSEIGILFRRTGRKIIVTEIADKKS